MEAEREGSLVPDIVVASDLVEADDKEAESRAEEDVTQELILQTITNHQNS